MRTLLLGFRRNILQRDEALVRLDVSGRFHENVYTNATQQKHKKPTLWHEKCKTSALKYLNMIIIANLYLQIEMSNYRTICKT